MTAVVPPPVVPVGRRDQAPAQRRVVRRPGLPGGRALVGGFLVAASAVGAFAAYSGAAAGPTDRYVVIAHDLAAGEVITSADLDLVAIDLPAGQRRVSFTDPGILIGTVTLGTLRVGQLVQSSDVAEVEAAGDLVELSVAVEPANAMNGDRRYLRGGERVDVVVTIDRGGSPTTSTVTRDALVVEVLGADDGLGGNGRLTVILAVRPDEAEVLAGAAASGDPDAAATLARWHGHLARALAGVINLLDPDVIVLGGGLSRIASTYAVVPALWDRWVFSGGMREPVRTRLLPALHGDASGVRGAAWLGRGLVA